jgi:hypothetical protein
LDSEFGQVGARRIAAARCTTPPALWRAKGKSLPVNYRGKLTI